MDSNKKIEQFKKENPFKVPEGYFENFTGELMQKLPQKSPEAQDQEPPVSLWQKMKPWIYMAAMFCGLYLMADVVFDTKENSQENLLAATAQGDDDEFSDEFIDQLLDTEGSSRLINDYTFYSYLTTGE